MKKSICNLALRVILLFGIFGTEGAFPQSAPVPPPLPLPPNQIYIRPYAGGPYGTGSGASWANAWRGFTVNQGKLLRPDGGLPHRNTVYWLSTGSYTGWDLQETAEAGTGVVLFKTATAEEHGTDNAGWNALPASEKTERVTFTSQLQFRVPYVVMDGSKRSSWTSGYGMYVSSSSYVIRVQQGNNASHLTWRFMEIEGDGTSAGNDCFNINNANCDNCVAEYCYLHRTGRTNIKAVNADNWVIQYCRIAENGGNPQHSEPFSVGDTSTPSNNWTVRYNQFVDSHGTGMIVFCGSGWKIYGNLAWMTPNGWMNGANRISSKGVVGSWNDQVGQDYFATGAQVYNNTFYNIRALYNGGVNFDTDDNAVVRNNAWVDCAEVRLDSLDQGTVASNNYYFANTGSILFGTSRILGAEDPFTDSANFDLTLKHALGPGANLSSEFNWDAVGLQRGIDGLWDVGAYEHDGSGATPPPTTLTPSRTPTQTRTRTPTPTRTRTATPTRTPTALATSATPTPIPTLNSSGLTAYWGLDDNAGPMAADATGNGNTGTLFGNPTWTLGQVGGALDFDGVGDYVSVGTNQFGLSAGMSILFWVRIDGAGADSFQGLVTRSSFVRPFRIEFAGNVITTGIRTAAGTNYLNSTTTLQPNRWYHVGLTYRSGSRVIYIDGQPNNSNAPTGNLASVAGVTTHLGARGPGSGLLNGALDDVQIFNRAFSGAEILSLFQSGAASKEIADTQVGAETLDSKSLIELLGSFRKSNSQDRSAEIFQRMLGWNP